MVRNVCTIEGCDKFVAGNGLCRMHYMRKRRTGDPLVRTLRVMKPETCTVDGCNREYKATGFCDVHWKRNWRYGSPHAKLTASPGEPIAFVKLAVENATKGECIVWPFATSTRGYGIIRKEQGPNLLAHRLALILHTGIHPRERLATHGPCHNPLCINPMHLSWGTHQTNTDDMLRDGTHPSQRKRG